MKHPLLAIALSGALAAGATWAAETDDLASQARRMDSLATSQGTARVESRISADFAGLAGSTANADALVTGLRNGTPITLASTDAKGVTTQSTFTPPTGRMGYGNVYTSLALAKFQLASLGITQPTAAQLQAALMGGTVTINGQTVSMTGVLQLRAQGMGWGQIAQQYGTKLGPVIRGMKSANAQVASQPATTTSTGASQGSSGVTTAAGGAGGQSHGQGNAYGRGITTAGGSAGPAGAQGQGNAYGHGIVSGAGGSPGNSAAAKGKGN